MERHIQSGLQALIVALLIFVGTTLMDVKNSTVETKVAIESMKQQINEINQRFDRYPTRDEVNARFDTAESARRDITRRVEAIEAHSNH